MRRNGSANGGGGVPLRVLVFEDHQEDVDLSLHALRSAGYEVTADIVVTLEDVAKRLRESSYDIILSDYRMQNATGMDAFEVTKAQGAPIPFVLVTGSLGEEKAVECLKQGVSDYVLKDRLFRLPSAVERALKEMHLQRERRRFEEALRHSEEQLRQRNRELEEQSRRAEAASRLKSEFLANMSHELRSPLNGIIGFSEMICDGKLAPESQKECQIRILKSARHLLRIISDVLDLSSIEAGKLEFQPEPVSISQLLAEACDSLATLAEDKHIRIERRIECEIDAVVDPARFQQVVYNYLSNAIKFTPEGGLVTVKSAPEGADEFRIEVTDTGAGIAEADMAHLFTHFHQLDSGKAKRFQGTGLGLALTRRIIEAQGGRVGVRSELGKGSTFFAVLPWVTAKAPQLVNGPAKVIDRTDGGVGPKDGDALKQIK